MRVASCRVCVVREREKVLCGVCCGGCVCACGVCLCVWCVCVCVCVCVVCVQISLDLVFLVDS